MDPHYPSNPHSPYALTHTQNIAHTATNNIPTVPQAMTAVSTDASAVKSSNALWYPDSGATHHLTADPALLHEPIEQFSTDQIYMGNGSSINIKASGLSQFYSSANPSVVFTLNNLLLVPSITKNLLSFSKFCKYNLCYFEFHSNQCLVKCQDSNQILFKGRLTYEGLYAFTDFLTYCSLFILIL
ncbi:unnamed protein product [Lupinus luteus]|uniref:Retrovirus-related Pol polyprotein from transposon TNT 1-94-like beta-barrel domain-containing protein n=1 Tax=Lupinus luteus TaxID=3873 RepID=A0AAV1YM18_LUPLU